MHIIWFNNIETVIDFVTFQQNCCCYINYSNYFRGHINLKTYLTICLRYQ